MSYVKSPTALNNSVLTINKSFKLKLSEKLTN